MLLSLFLLVWTKNSAKCINPTIDLIIVSNESDSRGNGRKQDSWQQFTRRKDSMLLFGSNELCAIFDVNAHLRHITRKEFAAGSMGRFSVPISIREYILRPAFKFLFHPVRVAEDRFRYRREIGAIGMQSNGNHQLPITYVLGQGLTWQKRAGGILFHKSFSAFHTFPYNN